MSDVDSNELVALDERYELLLSRDGHRTYLLCPGAALSIHRGEIDEDYMRALLGILRDTEVPFVAYVADVGALGRVTNAARRLVARNPIKLAPKSVEGRVYLINASVFARAASTMLIAVGRLASRRQTALLFRKQLTPAIDEAKAFARDVLARVG